MTLALWLIGAANAQSAGDPSASARCAEPFSKIQLGSEIGEISDALQVSDLVDAQAHVTQVHDRLPCLDEVVDKHLFALFARYDAVVSFYAQQEEDARRWEQASELAEPGLVWDERLFPPTHPLRTLMVGATTPTAVSMQEHGLLVPKGGGLFLNGDFEARPVAYDDLPGLVQVFDKSQHRQDGYWQEGARYLDRVLTDKVEDVPPPAWLAGGMVAVVEPGRPMPAPRPDPVPRPAPAPKPVHTGGGGGGVPVASLAVAGALGIVSGTTYALAGGWAAKLPVAANEAQLTKIRTNANLLVLVSGVSAAGAVGVGVGGFVLTGRF